MSQEIHFYVQIHKKFIDDHLESLKIESEISLKNMKTLMLKAF